MIFKVYQYGSERIEKQKKLKFKQSRSFGSKSNWWDLGRWLATLRLHLHAQRAGKRMTKICANYPPYLSPPQLPFYRLKKQAKVVTPFVASSLWPFLYPQKILLLRTKVHLLISPFLIWIWRGCCICKVEVGVVGWLNDGQVGFSFCPALHFTSLDRRLPPDPFLRASPNFHTTIISPPMDTSV